MAACHSPLHMLLGWISDSFPVVEVVWCRGRSGRAAPLGWLTRTPVCALPPSTASRDRLTATGGQQTSSRTTVVWGRLALSTWHPWESGGCGELSVACTVFQRDWCGGVSVIKVGYSQRVAQTSTSYPEASRLMLGRVLWHIFSPYGAMSLWIILLPQSVCSCVAPNEHLWNIVYHCNQIPTKTVQELTAAQT